MFYQSPFFYTAQDPSRPMGGQDDATDDTSFFAAADASEQTEELEQEITTLKQQLADSQERLMRFAADADNTRKRLEKEKMEVRLYAIQEFAKDLLPVVDAFDKATASFADSEVSPETEDGKTFLAIVEGVQMVTKIFYDTIKKHGIERVPGKGAPFNPLYHNAIAKVADASLSQDTVLDEFVAGYKIGERILRTAMVRVGSPD